jgi:acetyl-CoA carboxylase carboxyltransferase component
VPGPDAPRYPVLASAVDRGAEAFAANRAANLAGIEKLHAALARAEAGGGERAVTRHVGRGKLLPRRRIELLLDRDAHFLEVGALAGLDVPGQHPGAGVIGGVGVVAGVECLIVASDATVKGGAVGDLGVQKSARLAEIAEQNELPTIHLTESAGADLPDQARIFVPGGRTFRDLTRRSKRRAPSICLVFGSSTAGGAYVPGMSDYVVMVRDQAQVYLAGPPLVKMAIGEETDHEALGGAAMHAEVSGVADYLAEDEADAIRLGREIVAHLEWRKAARPRPIEIEPPRHDVDDLLGLAAHDVRQPVPAREVIARVVDGSRFSEFKPRFGPTLVCGWAHVHGFPVGLLASDGVLFPASAQKGAQFIQLCNQRHIPLLFLQNITGFMVGEAVERAGIIKEGAKLINAVANSTVPAITIMTGASFGAGNYAMCGRAYAPRFLYTWPGHRIAVMGARQLGGVLEIVQRQAAAGRGEPVDEQKLAVGKAMIEAQIDQESSAWYATARLWDDGVIDPRDTRDVVGIALSTAYTAPVRGTTSWGVFRH